jgi:alpha-1,6-mannosyltransferase
VLAAALGLAGLVILDREGAGRPWHRAAAAGICVGAAADIKATFILFGLAIAWALRRQLRQLGVAALGAIAVLIPSYGIAGSAAISAVTTRAGTGIGWGMYRMFRHFGLPFSYAVPVACVLLVPVAWLALTRLPEGLGNRPAVRAALAISLAWLLVWPHQYAWYSMMAICLLVFYPASRLDWLALTWLSAMTMADIPGLGASGQSELSWLEGQIQGWNITRIVPVVMLAALIAYVVLCLNRRWNPIAPGPGAELRA